MPQAKHKRSAGEVAWYKLYNSHKNSPCFFIHCALSGGVVALVCRAPATRCGAALAAPVAAGRCGHRQRLSEACGRTCQHCYMTSVFSSEATQVRWIPSALFALIVRSGPSPQYSYPRDMPAHYSDRKSPAHIFAAPHGAGGHVLRHAGRGDLPLADFRSSFLGTDDRCIVSADPVRRRAPRKCAAPLASRDYRCTWLALLLIGFSSGSTRPAALPGLRPAVGRIFPAHSLPAAAARLPGGLRMKAGMFLMHVWLPEAHPAAPFACSNSDVGRNDQDGHLRHTARRTAQIADLPMPAPQA